MKYYVDFFSGHIFVGAVLIEAPINLPDPGVMALISIRELHPGGRPRIHRLPRLTDEIPSRYYDRKLTREELMEIDRILGGDGSCTIPAHERNFDGPAQ